MAFYFRVLTTIHEEGKASDGSLKRYKKGEILESPNDLEKIFPNKFQRVQMRKKGKEVIPEDNTDEVDQEDVVNKPKKTKTNKEGPRGKDVTEKFKRAEKKGLKVFLMEEGYGVFSEDEDDPLNDEPFEDEDDVKLFIKDFGKEKPKEEEEDEEEEDEEEVPEPKKVKKKKSK